MNFQPDYRHIVNAAYNREAVRLPLYEHIVSADVIGKSRERFFPFSMTVMTTISGNISVFTVSFSGTTVMT